MKGRTGLAAAVVSAMALTAQATVYYAAPDGTSEGDGSRGSPYDIATALSKLRDWQGDEVRLLKGTYKVGSASLASVDCGARLVGDDGTASGAILDFERESKGLSVSTAGRIENVTLANASNCVALAVYGGSSDGCVVSNCVIRDCMAASVPGMLVGGTDPILIVDCVLDGISSSYTYGCALYVGSPNTRILRTKFLNNTSASWSGAAAIYGNQAGIEIERCTFSNNVVTSSRPGGAIFSQQDGLHIKDSFFYGNKTGSNGGAISVPSRTSNTNIIEGCTFVANSANQGGALWVDFYHSIVTNCTFVRNAATYGGAIACYSNSETDPIDLTICDCHFTNNVANGGSAVLLGRRGTALMAYSFEISRCDFVANTNKANGCGGGILVKGFARINVTDCLFDGNWGGIDGTKGEGGAIARTNDDWNSALGHAVCRRCVFRNNKAQTGSALAINAACYDCDFTANISTSYGPVYLYGHRRSAKEGDDGTLTNEFVNCHFKDNQVGSYTGIYAPYRSHFIIRDTTFTNGVATSSGWAVRVETPTYFEADRCQVVGTRAEGAGSGFYFGKGAVSDSLTNGFVRNSLFLDNRSVTTGGAGTPTLCCAWTNSWISGCTVVSNYVQGGIWSGIGNSSTQPDCISNCILYKNDCSNGSNYMDCNYDSAKFKNCFLSKNNVTYANGCIGTRSGYATPGFVDLGAGDFRLAEDSPCVDAGANEPWMTGAFDLRRKRSYPRIINGTVDMGCYEYRPKRGALMILR